jgi:HTH-type transcriptional regulator, transcriptional repressor of NAD biosynthesis genes
VAMWPPHDFTKVVHMQSAAEEEAAAIGGPVLVCDTDAFATPTWERRYLGEAEAQLDASTLGCGDVYLLTHHADVPFVQDGMRDGENVRDQMTTDFADALVRHERPWAVLTGAETERVALAERITNQFVARKLSFTRPI